MTFAQRTITHYEAVCRNCGWQGEGPQDARVHVTALPSHVVAEKREYTLKVEHLVEPSLD